MRYTIVSKYLIGLLTLSFITLAMTPLYAASKMFRFKDKQGKVVVSSTLPPEVSQKGYDIVNEMGVIIETVAPRKTKAQLLAEQAEKLRLEEDARIQREQELLDTILINSYTDISDIERARDSEIKSKERDVMLLKQNIRRLTRMLEDTQTRAARDERLGKEISQSIQDDIVTFKSRISSENAEIIKVKNRKEIIDERYTSSIIRFSELKAAEQLRRHRPEELESEDIKAIIYQCPSASICNSAWQASLRYASEYSTTELAWANESTIMMRKPRKDKDISVMISRIDSRNKSTSSLVMEVRCNKTQAGEELCNSEKVRSIKNGYISFINNPKIIQKR